MDRSGLLTRKEVEGRIRLGRSALYRMLRAGQFPLTGPNRASCGPLEEPPRSRAGFKRGRGRAAPTQRDTHGGLIPEESLSSLAGWAFGFLQQAALPSSRKVG